MSSEIEKIAAEMREAVARYPDNPMPNVIANWANRLEALTPPSSATPGEWVMVPREPTPEMLANAWDECSLGSKQLYGEVWKAMLAAAPQPQERAGSDATVADVCAALDRIPLSERPQPASDADGLSRIDGLEFFLHENPDSVEDVEPVRLVMAMSINDKVFCHRATQGDNGVCQPASDASGLPATS